MSNQYKIKPLDGFPLMSDNCWNAITDAVEERSRAGNKVTFLEWGSGNSTVNLVKKALDGNLNFKLISVDHEINFFPWLVESVVKEFCKKSADNNRISWQFLIGPNISFTDLPRILREKQILKCSSLYWQILLDNKRLQYVEQYQPNFNFSFIKMAKQLIKLILIELDYWLWIIKGIARNIFFKNNSAQRYQLSEPLIVDNFLSFFQKNPVAGCLKIKHGNVSVELWHIPKLKTFWRRELLLDGPVSQLPDYVNFPVNEKFDIIFIDGRARVSCAKRAYQDKLLKNNGWLFVHDAFRSEMMEAFQLFGQPPQFINGSNKMLNGQKRFDDNSGYPLSCVGDAVSSFNRAITQELFVYNKL